MNGKWDMKEKKKFIFEGIRDPINVRDIKGAYPKEFHGSKILRSLEQKPYRKEDNLTDSITDDRGHVLKDTGDRIYDTKRYIRLSDIKGSEPKKTEAVTTDERDYIRSNFPIIEAQDQSKFGEKVNYRKGRLPFSRNKSVSIAQT